VCKFNPKNDSRRIDPCIERLIRLMMTKCKGIKPLSSCCGHGKYPFTIIVTNGIINWELLSNEIIPRKKRFYVKDKQGYYYIPEVVKGVK